MASKSKSEALRRNSSLNPHPERVRDKLFLEQDFFDPCDIVQVRYEMLRRVRLEGLTVSASAKSFGLTRPTWYAACRSYEQGGLAALVPSRRGPRRAHKLGQEVVEALREERAKRPQVRAAELVRLVRERFGIRVHRRSVERALAKKNR